MSVCIATFDRPNLLESALDALRNQAVLPDEIIVSEPAGKGGREVVEAFSGQFPSGMLRHIPSERAALPWQRWWAFRHSEGDIVVFLDDDVRLDPEALQALREAYTLLEETRLNAVGVGFTMAFDGPEQPERDPGSLREWWLGTSAIPPGCLTPGGLTVSMSGITGRRLIEVEVLWGGAMSFRREALEDQDCMENLVALYEAGLGRGEDAILSHSARQKGRLFGITGPLALHPRPGEKEGPRPYAREGWKLGLAHTWGRAHTMRWLATDLGAYRLDWWRLASLEVGRCIVDIARRPWAWTRWVRLAGAFYGILHTVLHWAEIPPLP